jgi:hypothetical protein
MIFEQCNLLHIVGIIQMFLNYKLQTKELVIGHWGELWRAVIGH